MSASGPGTGDPTVSQRRDARKRKLYESVREREVYSYYESVLAYAHSEPKYCDLDSPEAVAEHDAVASADVTLTALVQLAALRIGTRRALISFLDAEYAYIIAESTRTLSLQDASKHDPDDALWLGFTKIPRGSSVWEGATDLPLNEGSNAQDPESASIAHIINDLSEDDRYRERPYVKDGPKARFYAGVPITTPRGINIGVLCVLDDDPRDGLEQSQVVFLQSMASTVMSHLELIRAKEENQRSSDMNSALAAFVEGKSKSGDWWHRDTRDEAAKQLADMPSKELRTQEINDRLPSISQTPGARSDNSNAAGYFDTDQQQAPNDDSGEFQAELTAREAQSTAESEGVLRPKPDSREAVTSTDATNTLSPIPWHNQDDAQGNSLSNQIRTTAARAAGLIQRGVGADGVLFLDATVGSAGSLIDSAQGLSTTETETDGTKPSDLSTTQAHHSQSQEQITTATKAVSSSTKNSVILGSAYATAIEERVRSAIQQAKFSEKVLKSLLRRYPNGSVWHFNAEGDASDEDDSPHDEQHGFTTDGGESAGSEMESTLEPTPTTKRASRRARTRKRDGRAIQSIFPGIRSLVFLGMWDPHQERWFGASIAVSYSSMRIFSVQSELSYIAAFCDVVLAEIWRLEAQELGRSKNDFVSSISHELRSPLHGILGSAECLEEQENSTLNAELIRSITACGNTLLDVVNDLLEYSRLNRGSQYRKKMQDSGPPSTYSDTSATASETSPYGVQDVESGHMINMLTEDAVNTACLGFDHQILQSKIAREADNDGVATLILNIEDAKGSDWMFSIASGSWKRICINLISNALKYTPHGYINVTLRKKPLQRKPGKERGALVEFIVEDSGIGMSNEFQVKSLFRPFRQENTLTPGTGLGLNLVAQIVKKQGGTVHVRSNKGRGTTVKVSLPLQSLPSTPSTKFRTSSLDLASPPASVGCFGFGVIEIDPETEPIKAKANRKLLTSIKRYCMELGLPVYAADDNLDSNATVHIISEQGLRRLSQIDEEDLRRSLLSADSLRKPMIIVCTTRDSAVKLQSGALGRNLPHSTQYLWLPIGPAKLAAALSACPGVLKESESGVAALDGVTEVIYELTKEKANRAEPPSFRDINLGRKDEDKDKEIINSTHQTDVAVRGNMPQVPRSPPQKSGSGVSGTPPVSTLPQRAQVTRASTAASASTEAFSLLLVDDNAINLRLLEVFAKKGGHAYRTAQNGQEAVDVYKQAARQERAGNDDTRSKLAIKPEVVLLDINMPVMDGFEAAREIRRFEIASGCPRAMIVAVTGLGDASAQEEAFASGMDMFLTKPVKMKEMTAMLAKIRAGDT